MNTARNKGLLFKMGSPSAFDNTFGPASGGLEESSPRRRARNSQSNNSADQALVQNFFGVVEEEDPAASPTPRTPSSDIQRSDRLIQNGNDLIQKNLSSKNQSSNEKPKKERGLDLDNVDWSGFSAAAHSGDDRKKRHSMRRLSLTGGVTDPKDEEARRAILRQSRRPSLDPDALIPAPPEELLPNSPVRTSSDNKKYRNRRSSSRNLMSPPLDDGNIKTINPDGSSRRTRSRSAGRRTARHSRRQVGEGGRSKSEERKHQRGKSEERRLQRGKSEERKHHRRNRNKDETSGDKPERKRGERTERKPRQTNRAAKESPKSLSPSGSRSRKKVTVTRHSLSPLRSRRGIQAAAASTTLQVQNKAYSRAKEGSQRVGRSIPINLDGEMAPNPLELQNEAMLNKAPAMRAIQW